MMQKKLLVFGTIVIVAFATVLLGECNKQPSQINVKESVVDVHAFNPIHDGNSHPLNERYATLAEAQAVYPHATALTDEIDWCSIQAAINYAYGLGGGIVNIPIGAYVVSDTITLKPGVILNGYSAIGYYEGLTNYASTNTGTSGSRIKAKSEFPTNKSLIDCELSDEPGKKAYGAKNIIFDANKSATYCFRLNADGSRRTERRIILENCHFQGASGHGLYFANVLAIVLTNNVISSNNGYGIRCFYGVSDSIFRDNYIHTNHKGGVYFGEGSINSQIIGGKIEDNYGEGLLVSLRSGSNKIFIDNVVFQANNGPAISANGGGPNNLVVARNSHFIGNAKKQANLNKTNVLCTSANIRLKNCEFDGKNVNYHISTKNSTGAVSIVNTDFLSEPIIANTIESNGGVNHVIGDYVENATSLPPANASQRGRILRIEGETGVSDSVYICIKTSNDTYTWVKIQENTM